MNIITNIGFGLFLFVIATLIGAILAGYRFAAVYKVLYAPADSRNPHLPIQRYRILCHPRRLAWKSIAGNRLFTALSASNHEHYIAFRADRVLSVNFAGLTLLSPYAQSKVKSTLTSDASPAVASAIG